MVLPCSVYDRAVNEQRVVDSPLYRVDDLPDQPRGCRYHGGMVNPALMEQVDQLSASELVELRDAIDARLGGDVPAEQWAILQQRVAEADANPEDYITLDEWKTRRRARRTA